MISRATVAAALAALAEMQGREVTDAQVKGVHAVIGADFDDETFAAACRQVARTCHFMPTPADFMAALEADQVDEAQEAAGHAWGLIAGNHKCRVYNPVSGSHYDAQLVEDVAGAEAAEAFIESGAAATADSSDEKVVSFARRDFVEAFVRRRRRTRRATAGLLTAGPVRLALSEVKKFLITGDATCQPIQLDRPPSAEEAAAITKRIEDRARRRRTMTDDEWKARKRELDAQAAVLRGERPAVPAASPAAAAADSGGRTEDEAE
jgi:hypothetical protein